MDRHGDAAAAVYDALGGGEYLPKLEHELYALTGRTVVTTSSFDGALHIALLLSGVRSGDYVFAPSVTFYSYLAPIVGLGGIPVFLDCEPTTRCVSPPALETALVWANLQNKLPKAVIIDNAFGSIADYDRLTPLCKAWNVPTVELCADALFGTYHGKPCGSNCDYGILGLGALGGGGAVCCSDDAEKVRGLCRYEYTDGISYDYRLNNFSAAIDYALLPCAKKIAERGRENLAALCAADCALAMTDGDSGSYALCRTDNPKALEGSGYVVKKPPLVHTMSRYSDCAFFEHEIGYSACRTLDDCVLVGLDISPLARIRLIKKLRKA